MMADGEKYFSQLIDKIWAKSNGVAFKVEMKGSEYRILNDTIRTK